MKHSLTLVGRKLHVDSCVKPKSVIRPIFEYLCLLSVL